MAEHMTYEQTKSAYLKVFAGLLVMTGLTVGAAAIPMPGKVGGTIHVAIGLLIAVIKVLMVLWIFMHLKFDNPWLRVFVILPIFFFFVLTFALNVLGP